jgi:DNA-binding NarL/FixJ family response regulator
VPADLEGLPHSLRDVAAGGAAMTPRVAMGRVRELRAQGAGLRVVRSVLTPREWEILELLSDGASMDDARAGRVATGRRSSLSCRRAA